MFMLIGFMILNFFTESEADRMLVYRFGFILRVNQILSSIRHFLCWVRKILIGVYKAIHSYRLGNI